MGKALLKQLDSMRKEIKEIDAEIEECLHQVEKYSDLIVSDTVKGTRKDGTYGSIKITGRERKGYKRQRKLYARKVGRKKTLKEKLERRVEEAEEYIESIEDSELRRLLKLRCIKNMEWQQVAECMGSKFNENKCKQRYSRFMRAK